MIHPKIQLYCCAIGILFTACASPKFSVVVLPDTQTYAQKFPEIFYSQLGWIDSNRKAIDFVLHVGDITQDNIEPEWEVARKAFDQIEGKVPYAIVPGNHDTGNKGRADVRETTYYNRYFAADRSGPANAGAYFETGKLDNAWHQVRAAKRNWIFLGLEFGPRNEVLDWANTVVRANPESIVVLFTHCYMYSDSTRVGEGDDWRPQQYGLGKDTGRLAVNDGEQIWEKLVRPNPNIRFVLSGHVLHSGVGTLVSTNDAGLPVYQMLANYQAGVRGSVNGGNGYLRVLTMDIRKGIVDVKTYSPYLNQYKSEPAHEFRFTNVPFRSR